MLTFKNKSILMLLIYFILSIQSIDAWSLKETYNSWKTSFEKRTSYFYNKMHIFASIFTGTKRESIRDPYITFNIILKDRKKEWAKEKGEHEQEKQKIQRNIQLAWDQAKNAEYMRICRESKKPAKRIVPQPITDYNEQQITLAKTRFALDNIFTKAHDTYSNQIKSVEQLIKDSRKLDQYKNEIYVQSQILITLNSATPEASNALWYAKKIHTTIEEQQRCINDKIKKQS